MTTPKIFLALLISIPLFSQIPNASFENWEQQSSWEVPVNWTTNNAEMGFVSVSKVASLSDGNYAMKVETRGASFEGFAPGIASCTFLCSDDINILELSYQIDSLVAGGHLEIEVSQYDGNEYTQIGYWKTESVSQGTEILEIPLSTINDDSLKIEIRANSILTALGYEGYAEIIVDQLGFPMISSTDFQNQENNISIYPNPSNGIITVQNCAECTYQIYGINGEKVSQGTVADGPIDFKESGLYTIIIEKGKHRFIEKVLINE